MDRRGFLGLIGCGAGAVVLGPLLPASEPVGHYGISTAEDLIPAQVMARRITSADLDRVYGGAAGGGKTNATLYDIDRLFRQYYGPMIEHEIERPTLSETFFGA